jgi:hypothetical protein
MKSFRGYPSVEDFKEKIIRQQKSEIFDQSSLPPEALAKLRSEGIDPETVTLKQLFPGTLDGDGNDLSLMSGAEWEIMNIYYATRKYLLECSK